MAKSLRIACRDSVGHIKTETPAQIPCQVLAQGLSGCKVVECSNRPSFMHWCNSPHSWLTPLDKLDRNEQHKKPVSLSGAGVVWSLEANVSRLEEILTNMRHSLLERTCRP
jgi:hypothetical protein